MRRKCERKESFSLPWSLFHFWRDTTASTAVEFSLILLPFIGLLGAIFDAGMLYFRATQLQLVTDSISRSALVNTLEVGQPGSTNPSLTYGQFINRFVCTWQTGNGVVQRGTLGKMFDCSRVLMRVGAYQGWIQQENLLRAYYPPSTDPFPVPRPGDIVVVKIGYPVSTFFRFNGSSFTFYGQNITMVEGIAIFRAEPGT